MIRKVMFWLLMGFLIVCVLTGVMVKILPAAVGQTAAAWFQAFGSILAIIGALWTVMYAHVIEKKARQKSILAIAEAANEHARRIGEALSTPEPNLSVADESARMARGTDVRLGQMSRLSAVYDKTIIDGVVRALTNAPVHEIGSRDGVMALLSLRDQFVFLGVSVDVFIAGPLNHPEMSKAIGEYSSPEHRSQRLETLESCNSILAGNISVHLVKIRSDYTSLVQAVPL